MRTTKIIGLSLLLCLFGAVSNLKAQDGASGPAIYGYAWIDFDDDTNTVIGTCETDMDYDVGEYYSPRVACSITDDSGNQVAYGYRVGYAGDTEVDITVEAADAPDVLFTVVASHVATLDYYDMDYSEGTYPTYYDYYNFTYFTDLGVYARCCFDFYGPGPVITRPRNTVSAGKTYDDGKPPRPTILKVKTWCTGGLNGSDTTGATLLYWLLNSSGGLSKQGWYVIEVQSDTSLTSDNTFGAGTSYTAGSRVTGDKFGPDDIGTITSTPHTSTQHFHIAAGIDRQQYPVNIIWFGSATPIAYNSISISSSDIVTINTTQTPDQNHCMSQ